MATDVYAVVTVRVGDAMRVGLGVAVGVLVQVTRCMGGRRRRAELRFDHIANATRCDDNIACQVSSPNVRTHRGEPLQHHACYRDALERQRGLYGR